MEKEIWKDIPNYEGIYQASNLGQSSQYISNCLKRKSKILDKNKVKYSVEML